MLLLGVPTVALARALEASRRLPDVREVGQAAPVRDVGGLGIGLAPSEGLVEMHDGSVSARSKGPGKGSRFEVRLPLAGTVTSALQQSGRASRAVGSTSTQCVLLADDNQNAADLLATLLRMDGQPFPPRVTTLTR